MFGNLASTGFGKSLIIKFIVTNAMIDEIEKIHIKCLNIFTASFFQMKNVFFLLISPSLLLMTGVRIISLGYILGKAKRKVGSLFIGLLKRWTLG